MNCFSHAYRFLDADPYFIVGTAMPDWLTLVDRKVRVRKKNAQALLDNRRPGSNGETADSKLDQLANGIIRHHVDDDWFHANQRFVEMNLEFSVELREMFKPDPGFRPHLVGHIVIELLLDAILTERDVSQLERYYQIVGGVDPRIVQSGVNAISARSTEMLTWFIPRFLTERYLFDYLTDGGVFYRLNRVIKRAKLAELPEDKMLDWLPAARVRVQRDCESLLNGFEPSNIP
jgi:hypothetical protein